MEFRERLFNTNVNQKLNRTIEQTIELIFLNEQFNYKSFSFEQNVEVYK